MKITELGNFTKSFGIVKSPCETVAEDFLKWQQGILLSTGLALYLSDCPNGLGQALSSLNPRTAPIITKYLFWPVDAHWTLYFDNGVLGTDAGPPLVLSSRLGVESFRVVMADEYKDPDSKIIKRYGAVILEYFDSGIRKRSIFAANDGGRWKFGERGEPFPFEDASSYSARSIKGRFTKSMLLAYLRDFGVDLNCISDGPGFLLVKRGEMPSNFEEFN